MLKKYSWKIVNFSLVLILAISFILSPATVSASTNFNKEKKYEVIYNSINSGEADLEINIIRDNKDERVVESVQAGIKSLIVYDKLNNTLTAKEEGHEEVFLDLNQEIEETPEENDGEYSTFVAKSVENTWTNYEYTVTHSSPEKWELRMPKGGKSLVSTTSKKVTKSKKNKDNLNNFRKSVNSLNDYEALYIGAALSVPILTIGAAVLTALSGGLAIGTALVALGVTGKAFTYAVQLSRAAKNAKFYYYSV